MDKKKTGYKYPDDILNSESYRNVLKIDYKTEENQKKIKRIGDNR